MKQLYSVVKFISDNTVQLVPTSWVSNDSTSCKWPVTPVKGITSLIKRRKQCGHDWQYLDVKLLGTCDDYSFGKSLEKQATVTSSLDISGKEDERSRKRKRCTTNTKLKLEQIEKRREDRVTSSSEGSDSENSSSSGTVPVNIPKGAQIGTPLTHVAERSLPNRNLYQLESSVDIIASAVYQHGTHEFETDALEQDLLGGGYAVSKELAGQAFIDLDQQDYTTRDWACLESANLNGASAALSLKQIFARQLAFERLILTEITSIKDDIKVLLTRVAPVETDSLHLPLQLPLKEVENLKKLESWAQDTENFNTLVKLFASYGGKNTQKVVSGILNHLISKDIGTKINFTGSGPSNKSALKDNDRICSAILRGCRLNAVAKGATDREICRIVVTWKVEGLKGGLRQYKVMSSYRSKRRRINQEVQELQSKISAASERIEEPPVLNMLAGVTVNVDIRSNSSLYNRIAVPELEIEPLIVPNDRNRAFSTLLAEWSLKHNITHSALSDLAKLINPFLNHADQVHISAKALLRTPRCTKSIAVAGGKFHYFGIRDQIVRQFEETCLTSSAFPYLSKIESSYRIITLSVGTDGILLSKSTNVEMWPILFKVDQFRDCRVLVAGLFCGKNKPGCLQDFLLHFTKEIQLLENEGVILGLNKYAVRISCIIADAPARSFIKGTKPHTAYHGCERCVCEGEWDGRIIYPTKPSNLRTDETFRLRLDPDHHLITSPFCILRVGLVSQVVLDYMHLICLGVVRKLLYLWVKGPLRTRLPFRSVNRISEYLVTVSRNMPCEFARKPRSLKDLKRFKATELRLLYTGPCALERVLPKEQYQNFLQLHVATSILLSEKAAINYWNDIARNLIQQFVEGMRRLYGKTTIVYNVHSLLHLCADALRFWNLDQISAFPFENFLQSVKKMVRGQKLHFDQVVNRICEKENCSFKCHNVIKKSGRRKVLRVHRFGSFTLGVKMGNNCFLTKAGCLAVIVKLYEESDCIKLDCYEFKACHSISSFPIKSSELGIFRVEWKFKPVMLTLEPNDLSEKYVVLPCKSGNQAHYCIPMLHAMP